MDKSFQRYWNRLFWKFRISQIAALLLISGAITLITIGTLAFVNISWPYEFTLAYFLLFVAIFSVWSSFWHFSKAKLKERMHQLYPELEYSLHLFLEDHSSALSNFQKEKIIQRLPPLFKIPVDEDWAKMAVLGFLAMGIYFIGLNNYNPEVNTITIPDITEVPGTIKPAPQNEPFVRGKSEILISPPPYTQLKSRAWEKDIKIPEGSKLSFFIQDGNTEPYLIQQGTDTLSFSKTKQVWEKHFWLNYATAFQLYFQKEDSTLTEDLMVFEILKDQKPMISTSLEQNRVEISWEQLNNTFDLAIQMSDDYGLTEANIIATLSKGDGESVKFRELKWALQQFNPGYKSQNIDYQLRMDTLGLDPGDELYFYFEVFDNKYPENQSAKSEVYFIEVADTTLQESIAFEGLALSTEPEFFKSQRQIIIDTEKLIKDQNKLSRNAFEDKSDEIGADQKLLRLRYGIFLGEEYEVKGGMGKMAGNEEDHSDHDHEEGEEHDQSSHAGHDHGDHEDNGSQPNERNFSNDLYNSPELEAYVHSHDNSEIATFFDADVKQKLKEALANMWEAELYLRTYRPKLALPYEYRALELIKDVQRASRIYVERMGFEPPPLEPDKRRLTGDLKAIKPKTGTFSPDLDNFWGDLRTITTEMKEIVDKDKQGQKSLLVNELSDLLINEMIENPVRYAQILVQINNYKQSATLQSYEQIIFMLEQILPVPNEEFRGIQSNKLQLKSIFHQQLQPE